MGSSRFVWSEVATTLIDGERAEGLPRMGDGAVAPFTPKRALYMPAAPPSSPEPPAVLARRHRYASRHFEPGGLSSLVARVGGHSPSLRQRCAARVRPDATMVVPLVPRFAPSHGVEHLQQTVQRQTRSPLHRPNGAL